MSEYLVALVLGIVEGLTEFLPVSSTGHLIIVGNLLGFSGQRADTFEIFIQSGAILAVIVLYIKYFLGLVNFKDSSSTSGFSGTQGLIKLFIAALPVYILGFATHKYIKEYLFSPVTVAIGLAVGAIAIFAVEKRFTKSVKSEVSELSLGDCLKIGLFQCLALWPGVSRSGATIMGGLLLGFERRLAAEFSFILAVPVLIVACGYDLLKSLKFLQVSDIPFFAIGFFVSFIVALLTIKALLAFIQRSNFIPFAYYRLILAVIVIAVL